MPDFLIAPFAAGPAIPPAHIAVRLVVGLLLGIGVSLIYRWTRSAADIAPSFPPTLVLLSILIAMVTQVVGDSPARAFALVGALSIVRFRTVVRDTQDTAYVIFAVIVGMAAGAAELWVALIGMAVVAVAAVIMRPRGSAVGAPARGPEFELEVRVAIGHDLTTLVGAVLDAHLSDCQLREIGTAKQGISLQAEYDVRLKPGISPADLIKALNRIEGVQDAQLRRRDVVSEQF